MLNLRTFRTYPHLFRTRRTALNPNRGRTAAPLTNGVRGCGAEGSVKRGIVSAPPHFAAP